MTLALKLLAAFLAGFGLHTFYKPTQALGDRWGGLARYAIGALGMLPFLMMLEKHYENEIEDYYERTAVSYLLVLGAFGSGTFTGHISDRYKDGVGDD